MTARFYLYGRGRAEIWSLLAEPALARWVAEIRAAGRAQVGDHRELAERAVACGLLTVTGDGALQAGARLVPIPRRTSRHLAALMAPALEAYAPLASDAVAGLRRAWRRTAAAGEHSWAQVAHALVAGMLLDLSVGSRLWLGGRIHRAFDDTLVWAFEESAGRNPFGVQWVAGGGRWALAQLWHAAVDRSDLAIARAAVDALHDLRREGYQAASRSSARAPHHLLHLRYLGFVRQRQGTVRSAIPVFDRTEMETLLLPALSHGAERLVTDAVLPAVSAAESDLTLRRLGSADSSRHALVRMVLELGIDRTIEAGVLSAFPLGVPPVGWGRWAWAETAGGRSLVAGAFDGSSSRRREPATVEAGG